VDAALGAQPFGRVEQRGPGLRASLAAPLILSAPRVLVCPRVV
jgi:hypothetical protein